MGGTRLFEIDEIGEFEEDPGKHFQALEELVSEPPNFESDTKEVLMEKKWKGSDLVSFMKEKFNQGIPVTNKSEMIDKLLYARDNAGVSDQNM